MKPQIPHVYSRVEATALSPRDGLYIELRDGTSFTLPHVAMGREKLLLNDLVLIDLSHWNGKGKIAHVFVYRERTDLHGLNEVTNFSIGENCGLSLPTT